MKLLDILAEIKKENPNILLNDGARNWCISRLSEELDIAANEGNPDNFEYVYDDKGISQIGEDGYLLSVASYTFTKGDCQDCDENLDNVGVYYIDDETRLCAHCADKKGLIE